MERLPKILDKKSVYTFQDLPEAIDFIATCLERNEPIRLLAQIEHVGRRVAPGQVPYVDRFQAAFRALARFHAAFDLRQTYRGAHFPKHAEIYHLAGPVTSATGAHLVFVRHPDGWRLAHVGMEGGIED